MYRFRPVPDSLRSRRKKLRNRGSVRLETKGALSGNPDLEAPKELAGKKNIGKHALKRVTLEELDYTVSIRETLKLPASEAGDAVGGSKSRGGWESVMFDNDHAKPVKNKLTSEPLAVTFTPSSCRRPAASVLRLQVGTFSEFTRNRLHYYGTSNIVFPLCSRALEKETDTVTNHGPTVPRVWGTDHKRTSSKTIGHSAGRWKGTPTAKTG
ncbi:hypothetical protein C8J57DRAFT_1472330 [Mycena rebaudengoi]|nr:hypothetical protein C8J57DRAFT_1472330 [Mycena rebaudengoi]